MLRGGPEEDRSKAGEWMSMFWREAVVGVG